MFTEVLKTVAKFLIILVIFIIAFGNIKNKLFLMIFLCMGRSWISYYAL